MGEIEIQINKLMSESFEIPMEKLRPSATVFDELGLDSLDAIDMLVSLEDRFNIKVDVQKLKNVKTLQDVYDLALDVAGDKQIQFNQ